MKTRKNGYQRKDPNVYPPGWNYKRAMAVARYYDARKDESVLDESAEESSIGLVWMEVPEELVADVKKLIARRRKSA